MTDAYVLNCPLLILISRLGEDWKPDNNGMGDLNDFMAAERSKSGKPAKPASTSYAGAAASQKPVARAAAVSTPPPSASKSKSKAFFDDDDIDTLLALKPNDLLRSAMMDEVDEDEVDMSTLLRVANSSAGISGGASQASHMPPGLSAPPGLGYGNAMGAGPMGYQNTSVQAQQSMPPGINLNNRGAPGPIGSPSRHSPSAASSDASAATSTGAPNNTGAVPKPPQLTSEQLASLTPQQLSHMEQWNLLYQQQQLREMTEAATSQRQLLSQHQQMLAQREEAAKRAAMAPTSKKDARPEAANDEEDGEDDGEDGEDGEASGDEGNNVAEPRASKANRKGRWAGKATARMSPYEIDMLIRAMEHQVASENPFLDDYYNQNVRIMLDPNSYTVHRPICDVAPPKRRQLDKDPFTGCLGRIPSGSSRAPRVCVVMDAPEKAHTALKESGEDANKQKANKKDKTLTSSATTEAAEAAPKKEREYVFNRLIRETPFRAPLGHMAQPGGVSVSDERRIMLTIEDAFVILLELEDLKQLQHLHMHAAAQPLVKLNEGGAQNEKHARQKDAMIMDHLAEIISLLRIPRIGTPESSPSHPSYATWAQFMINILRIPKGARMLARLLLLLPGAAALSILRVFARHLTELARLSLSEDHATPLVAIADYVRRVLLQADWDILEPITHALLDDSTNSLLPNLRDTLMSKVGFYLLYALLCRVHDLKDKPTSSRDPRVLSALPAFLRLHQALGETLRGHLVTLVSNAHDASVKRAQAARQQAQNQKLLATAVAPSNPRHTKPLTRTTKTSSYTSEAQMWEFVFYLMLCSSVQEKKQIHSELQFELAAASIKPETPIDIVNLKTAFTGVLAKQADPGFELVYKQAQHAVAQAQRNAAPGSPSPQPGMNIPHQHPAHPGHQHHAHHAHMMASQGQQFGANQQQQMLMMQQQQQQQQMMMMQHMQQQMQMMGMAPPGAAPPGLAGAANQPPMGFGPVVPPHMRPGAAGLAPSPPPGSN